MPQRITVEFYCSTVGEYWTNRYFTTDAVNAAGDTIDALAAAHISILRANCVLTKVRVDDNIEDTDNYDTVSFNTVGGLTTGGVNTLALFNVARVDFDVAGGGRPSRKYLRGYLTEADANFLGIETANVTQLNTFADAIVAIGTICDPQGALFVDGVVWPFVQMRQLRRGSKKKTTP